LPPLPPSEISDSRRYFITARPALKSFQFMMALSPMMNVPCVCQRHMGRMVNITMCP